MDTRGVDPFEGEPPSDDWPAGRPYPTRPYPTRPYPTRPYPTRPYPTRPYPTRPYGAAQGAWRPYPTRPYPTRPYPTREEDVLIGTPDGSLDADEWTTDVSALFLSHSAVVRLGGRLLVGEGRIPVPRLVLVAEPEYLFRDPEPPASDAGPAQAPESDTWQEPKIQAKPEVRAEVGNLWPNRNELAWKVVLPDGLAQDLAEQPEPAWGVKEEIAEALALGADRLMLNGVYGRVAGAIDARDDRLEAGVRPLLARVRSAVRSSFRDAGWILSPTTLDSISQLELGDGSWDSTQLVIPDGEDGGTLLGYPFIATRAAGDRLFFSADWSEVWIAMRRRIVTVAISKDAHFQSDETVIRAVSEHDLLVRRPELFAAADV
jgi:hypothetical protein